MALVRHSLRFSLLATRSGHAAVSGWTRTRPASAQRRSGTLFTAQSNPPLHKIPLNRHTLCLLTVAPAQTSLQLCRPPSTTDLSYVIPAPPVQSYFKHTAVFLQCKHVLAVHIAALQGKLPVKCVAPQALICALMDGYSATTASACHSQAPPSRAGSHTGQAVHVLSQDRHVGAAAKDLALVTAGLSDSEEEEGTGGAGGAAAAETDTPM